MPLSETVNLQTADGAFQLHPHYGNTQQFLWMGEKSDPFDIEYLTLIFHKIWSVEKGKEIDEVIIEITKKEPPRVAGRIELSNQNALNQVIMVYRQIQIRKQVQEKATIVSVRDVLASRNVPERYDTGPIGTILSFAGIPNPKQIDMEGGKFKKRKSRSKKTARKSGNRSTRKKSKSR